MIKHITIENPDGSVRVVIPDDSYVRLPKKWVQDLTDLTPTERWILTILKSYKGMAGAIYPSLRELARTSGYSLPTTWKIIKRLELKKRIIITKRKGKYNTYRILEKTV